MLRMHCIRYTSDPLAHILPGGSPQRRIYNAERSPIHWNKILHRWLPRRLSISPKWRHNFQYEIPPTRYVALFSTNTHIIWCHNFSVFSKNTYNRHPIATQSKRGVGRILWVTSRQCHGVPNHRRPLCLFNRLLQAYLKKTSKFCVDGPFARGIHRWPMDSPHKGQATRNCVLTSSCQDRFLPHVL